MFYFSYISNSYTTKNKLEAAVLSFLKSHARTVIPQENLKQFKDNITAGIKNINENFSKCKAKEPYWWATGDSFDIHLNVEGVCNFHLYQGEQK